MNSNNDTNRTNKIEVAAIAAGAVIALTSLLPMAAQAAPPKKHQVHHTAVHRSTRRHTTQRIAANRPKSIVIHGYGASHPYSQSAYNEGSYINVTTGRTATVSSSELPGQRWYPEGHTNHRWYPEGHSGPGGVIEADGSLSAYEAFPDMSPAPPGPDFGAFPNIIQYPPYSFVGADNVGGFGEFGAVGGYGNVVIPETPVIPVVPTVPVVPVTTPVVP